MAKRQELRDALALANVALDLATDANGDASYRVGDWPGPDKSRAAAIERIRGKVREKFDALDAALKKDTER